MVNDSITPSTIAPAPDGPNQPLSALQAFQLEQELQHAREKRAEQVQHSLAPNTQRAYAQAWRAFQHWCTRMQAIEPTLIPIPVSDDTLSLYIGALNDKRPATVRQAVAAIRLEHERAGYPMLLEERPATVKALTGHAKLWAKRAPKVQKTEAVDTVICQMADTCDTTTSLGLRNRALLLVGFDAALRRSELVGIDVEHLERRAGVGISVRLPHSKTDQTGKGASVAILARPASPWCPVEALERWLESMGRTAGPVFVALRGSRHCANPGQQRLSDRAVARIVKQAAADAGVPGDFSGHSLRRGMISTAMEAGVAPDIVRQHARHASIDTTLDYARKKQALDRHPGTGLNALSPQANETLSLNANLQATPAPTHGEVGVSTVQRVANEPTPESNMSD